MAGTARGPIAFAQYAALRAAALAVRAGDEATALGLAGDVGRLIGQLPRNQRRTVTHLAQAFPERSLADLEALGRDSFAHLARLVAVDTLSMTHRIRPEAWEDRINTEDVPEGLDARLREDGPSILITGHCGVWEVLSHWLAMIDLPVHALARPIDNQYIDRWLRREREASGTQIIVKWGSGDRMQELLQEGARLGFVADQNAGGKGMFVPFFGRLASTYKSIGFLARRFNAPVVAGIALRDSDTRLKYRIRISDVIEPSDWSDVPDPDFYLAARIQRALEKMILMAPDQHMWVHQRWKSRPRFEREDRPFPERLLNKLRELPWMDEDGVQQIVAARGAPPAPAGMPGLD
jgi:KDO2-lipid IV(A) lauroyltransferase